MPVIWNGRGVVLTPAFRALVERKLQRATRLLDRVTEARVTCVAEKFRRTARLTVRAGRRTFTAAATAADLLAAVDGALAVIRRQAGRVKDRRRA